MGNPTTPPEETGWRKLFQKNRHWLGASLLLSGVSLSVVHYVDYGYILHWPVSGLVIDHGVVGILLVILGGILAAGKPGAKKDR